MKKIIFMLVGILVGAMIVISLGLIFGIDLPMKDKNDELVITPTPTPASSLEKKLTLNFDDIEDIFWLSLDGSVIATEKYVSEGKFLLKDWTFLNHELKPGSIIHFRIKPPETQNAQFSSIIFDITPSRQINGESFRLSLPSREQFYFTAMNSLGYKDAEFKGLSMLCTNHWMDVIVYISEKGDVIGTVVSELENPDKITCASYRLPELWQFNEMRINFFQDTNGWSQEDKTSGICAEIDFLNITNGSIIEYLEEHIPAYSSNQTAFSRYLTEEVELLDESNFIMENYFGEEGEVDVEGECNIAQDASYDEILDAYFNNTEIKMQGLFLELNSMGAEYEIISDDNNSFYAFTTSSSEATVEINPRMKEAGDSHSNQQGFYTKFEYNKSIGSSFEFQGARKAYITFEDDGLYFNFSVANYREQFNYNLEEPMILEDGKTYNMVIAFDENSIVRCIIWEANNFNDRAFFQCDLSLISIDVLDNDWKAVINITPENRMEMYENIMFTFDNFKDDMPH